MFSILTNASTLNKIYNKMTLSFFHYNFYSNTECCFKRKCFINHTVRITFELKCNISLVAFYSDLASFNITNNLNNHIEKNL